MRTAWAHLPVVPEPAVGPGLEVAVIYTDLEQTRSALRAAGRLARGLDARIHLIVPQIVPFPLSFDQPLVEKGFAERKFRALAEESGTDTRVEICLCREWQDAVVHCLKPSSTVVMGMGTRWWRSRRERRLAHELRDRGHHVVLAEGPNA